MLRTLGPRDPIFMHFHSFSVHLFGIIQIIGIEKLLQKEKMIDPTPTPDEEVKAKGPRS